MPDKVIQKKLTRERRHRHILKTIRGTEARPRLVVFRSNKHIYAQIVDDLAGHTLLSASTLSKALHDDVAKAKNKTAQAKLVGMHIAELAKSKNFSRIIFDRGGYLYHGRVKALAEGAREGGLEF